MEAKPATVNGVHLARMECDRWGNLIATRYFGLDGVTPARRAAPGLSGPSEIVWTFDDLGRPETLTSRGIDGEVARFSSIVTRFEWTAETGHVIRIVEDGYIETEKRLYTRMEITVGRDKARKEKEMSWNYFDKEGKPVRNEEGYRTYTEVHDAAGRPIRRIQSGYDEAVHSYAAETIETGWEGGKKRRKQWACSVEPCRFFAMASPFSSRESRQGNSVFILKTAPRLPENRLPHNSKCLPQIHEIIDHLRLARRGSSFRFMLSGGSAALHHRLPSCRPPGRGRNYFRSLFASPTAQRRLQTSATMAAPRWRRFLTSALSTTRGAHR